MRKGKITAVKYNFHQTSDENGSYADGDYDYAELGKEQHPTKEIPVEILEREPTNGLERHFVDIKYKSGAVKRVFALCEIDYARVSD